MVRQSARHAAHSHAFNRRATHARPLGPTPNAQRARNCRFCAGLNIEINGLFESCLIAIDHSASGSTVLCFQQIAVMNSFTVSAIAVLARWLKMDAEETRVLGLDRDAEQ
jgi:hypothetical protein